MVSKWYEIHMLDDVRKLRFKGTMLMFFISFLMVMIFGNFTHSFDTAYIINSCLGFALGFKRKASLSNQLVFSIFVIALFYYICYQTEPEQMIHVSAGHLSMLLGIFAGEIQDRLEKEKLNKKQP
ncbi:hypothetical protein [Neobacillus sp. LXY-1]|uniref:hypothetical protein n=1 Tax=Neobacillus sp. LXY-1 TaxID=3379133 RepID=UPI003EDEA64A